MDAGFLNHTVVGVPLLFVVLGLVEFLKQFKRADGSQLICGNWLLAASMVLGLVLGGGFMLSTTPLPGRPGSTPSTPTWWIAYGYWFALVFYGLAIGLVASGLYDTIKGLVDKVVKTAILKD